MLPVLLSLGTITDSTVIQSIKEEYLGKLYEDIMPTQEAKPRHSAFEDDTTHLLDLVQSQNRQLGAHIDTCATLVVNGQGYEMDFSQSQIDFGKVQKALRQK